MVRPSLKHWNWEVWSIKNIIGGLLIPHLDVKEVCHTVCLHINNSVSVSNYYHFNVILSSIEKISHVTNSTPSSRQFY